MQISNEYLLKVRNMYDELNSKDYKLNKLEYSPYSASKLQPYFLLKIKIINIGTFDLDKSKVKHLRSHTLDNSSSI